MLLKTVAGRSPVRTLFTTLLLVIVIPLSFLFVFFITLATTMVREDYLQFNRQSVSNVCNTLNMSLNARLNLAYALGNNLHVKNLANTSMDISPAELRSDCRDVSSYLIAAHTYADIFSHTAIYFPDRELVIGTLNPHITPEAFYSQYVQLQDMDASAFYQAVRSVDTQAYLPARYSRASSGLHGDTIVYVQPIRMEYIQPRAYFITLINARTFSDLALSAFEPGTHFRLYDANGTELLHSSGIPAALNAQEFSDSTVLRDGLQRYYLFSGQSALPALQYTFFIPQSSVLRQLNTYILLWFLFLLICLIIGIVLAHHAARQVHRPIQTLLYEAFPGGPEQDVHSIQAEIALVADKMHADAHRSQQAESELRAYYESMRTTEFMRLLTSSLNMSAEVLRESAEMADLPVSHAIYRAAMLEQTLPDAPLSPPAQPFSDLNVRSIRFSSVQSLFLLISSSQTLAPDTKRFLSVLSAHPQTVRVGVSRSYEDLRMLQRCLSESSVACRHHITPEKPYVIYDTLLTEAETIYYPADKEMQLLAAVRSGDYDEVCTLLTDIRMTNLNERRLVPAMVRLLYNSMIATAMKAYDQLQTEAPQILMENIQTLSNLQDYRELDPQIFDQILRCYASLCEACSQSNQHKNHQVIENVLAYLEEAYVNPALCLDMVADHLRVSYYFLSRIFKEETSKSFSDMLNDIRIRHALELLTTTSDSVQDISAQVGYTNWSTYLRAFRKRTGTTPAEYRRSFARTASQEEARP